MGAGGRLTPAVPRTWDELTAAVRDIGPAVGPEAIQRSAMLFAPLHADESSPSREWVVEPDLAYGSHPAQALDLYLPAAQAPRAVVLFVHGGAFVAGGRRRPGSPYHGNIGRWAARRGWVGAIIGHRLAPTAQWPEAANDVALAVAWCRDRFRGADGTPLPVHLVGNSSGAVHAATCAVGGPGLEPLVPPPASLALVSGIYDLPAFGAERLQPYFGVHLGALTEWDFGAQLAASTIPQFFAVGELDTADAHEQFLLGLAACVRVRGTLPACARARAANHFTITYAVGTPFDGLGPSLGAFLEEVDDC